MESSEIAASSIDQVSSHRGKRGSTASLLLSPAFQGLTAVINCVPTEDTDTDPGQVLEELQSIIDAVSGGDMKHPESMAISQATALNIMFGRLASAAMRDIRSPYFDSLMRLALRAQSQSSRTLQTLKTLKSPSIVADQVNVAHQQIVNNAPAPNFPAPSASPT